MTVGSSSRTTNVSSKWATRNIVGLCRRVSRSLRGLCFHHARLLRMSQPLISRRINFSLVCLSVLSSLIMSAWPPPSAYPPPSRRSRSRSPPRAAYPPRDDPAYPPPPVDYRTDWDAYHRGRWDDYQRHEYVRRPRSRSPPADESKCISNTQLK